MTEKHPMLRKMHQEARSIFDAAIKAVDPVAAIKKHVTLKGATLSIGSRRYDLNRFDNIFVVGAGKATAPMARALEQILGDRITDGVIVIKDGHGVPLQHIRTHEASHPVPDERGVRGTEAVLALAGAAGQKDLVVCLISGGGSALLVAPAQNLTLADKQATTRQLLACGATIHEINTVRKHLSRVKGGWLAHLAAPATVATLILSDVVGDDLDVIASGPTVADTSTFEQAWQVFKHHAIIDRLAPAVKDHFIKGIQGQIQDTPKAHDPVFERVDWTLVGTNLQGLQAARTQAEKLGYTAVILSSRIEGEAREIAKVFVGVAREVQETGHPVAVPACILAGGETTVTIEGNGKGGRNQEFGLAAAVALDGEENIVVLSGGTDGTDGPTDAAGAIADGQTIERARKLDLDARQYLKQNDSYTFFQQLDDLLMTGPTRTNVMDVYMILVRDKNEL